MKKILGGLLLMLALAQQGQAQTTRYVVKFRNKGTSPFALNAPLSYLSQRAIDRRTRYGITIDSTDLPVTPRYLDSIRLAGTVTILNASRWLNSVSIQTTDAAALTKINSFPFVESVSTIAARTTADGLRDKFAESRMQGAPATRELGIQADFFNYGSSFAQVHIHNGEFLHNIGLRGQNMVIGVLDAGFNNYLTVKATDSLRANNQILGTWDFVARDASVNEDNQHGMQCLSVIGANVPGQFVGTAPKANFYLYRTEDAATEYPIEEHNWVVGAERLDSAGGDLISSSLGYNTFDAPLAAASHTYADMNGNTTIVAIGADLAAKKGILVVNANGNEGNNSWRYLITPADGDSVLAVGAVSTAGAVGSFSSFGPSSDGQVKPDVASVGVGTVVQFSNNAIGTSNGTSFACPNMAGLATCLWQGFPEYNNMKIINALRQSASKFTNPDDRVGYGIPDVKKATLNLLKEFSTANASLANCRTTINWTSKDVSSMKYEIERRLAGEAGFTKVGEVQGTGSAFGIRPAYQHQDQLTGILAGTHTYRIRQVVDTAAASFTADYIDTVTVTLGSNCTATSVPPVDPNAIIVTLAPNPVRNAISLKVTTPNAITDLRVRIVSNKGQVVGSFRYTKTSGTSTFTIPVTNLASGQYYLSVSDREQLISTKEFIKL